MSASTPLSAVSEPDLRAELRRRALGQKPELGAFSDNAVYEQLIATQRRLLNVFGTDDRRDFYELNATEREDADSVVLVLTRAGDLLDNGNGTFALNTQPFNSVVGQLCPAERFWAQPSGGNECASGVLVAEDLVATAGHVLERASVTRMRFVFGYRMSAATKAETIFSSQEIYSGVSVVDLSPRQSQGGDDWALIRLDRPVKNHRIAPLRRAGRVNEGDSVHVIGFPGGLPLKFAGQAQVLKSDAAAYFVTNIDAFSGNSGSPVFNSRTREVEGLFVRGGSDFEFVGSCRRTVMCSLNGCLGQECTRVAKFVAKVPG